jgi:hypothetical protein
MKQHPKRPRNTNQWAKHMTDIVVGEGALTPKQRV